MRVSPPIVTSTADGVLSNMAMPPFAPGRASNLQLFVRADSPGHHVIALPLARRRARQARSPGGVEAKRRGLTGPRGAEKSRNVMARVVPFPSPRDRV